MPHDAEILGLKDYEIKEDCPTVDASRHCRTAPELEQSRFRAGIK